MNRDTVIEAMKSSLYLVGKAGLGSGHCAAISGYEKAADAILALPVGGGVEVPIEPTAYMLERAAFNLCAAFGVEFTRANERFVRVAWHELVLAARAEAAISPRSADGQE